MGESDGIRMEAFFNPNGEGIPFETVALVLAAVRFINFYKNSADHSSGSHHRIRERVLPAEGFHRKGMPEIFQILP